MRRGDFTHRREVGVDQGEPVAVLRQPLPDEADGFRVAVKGEDVGIVCGREQPFTVPPRSGCAINETGVGLRPQRL